MLVTVRNAPYVATRRLVASGRVVIVKRLERTTIF